MNFNDREAAEAYLKDKNAQRMAGLPVELVEMLSGRPAHVVAEWLDKWGDGYKNQAAGPSQIRLTDDQRRVAQAANMTDEQYIDAVKKYSPEMYQSMAAAQASAPPKPVKLTDEHRSLAQKYGLTDEEYIAALGKADPGLLESMRGNADSSPEIQVTDNDRFAAKAAQAQGYNITPEAIAKRRAERG